MPLDCTGCCAGCKPRWMNLVNNIYPANPQDGLIKANMPKLTYYALSNPQKLDRIGEYLSKRLSRDLQRNRIGFASIAMEAMDKLLVACHSQSLNLFVESFLKMVQKLLECSDPEMQCLATVSFVKFSNIEEDTPSYHRRYDFFVSQFSAMCHSNHHTAKLRIRTSGIQGLQGVIRKTVCDELQPDIWAQHHMDKIVPSLLYNMHSGPDNPTAESAATADEEPASAAAEKVFRDLVCRAAFSNLKSVLQPVLLHMDSHNLWTKTVFPSACFKIIMYSVQAQYSHIVVQKLMSHLDMHSKSPARLKARITDVLSETVIIAAGGSIGPSVLEVFNSLLRHLRVSVEYTANSEQEQTDNTRFQESIINTIGEFANHLPDFQKIEILMFVINKMPTTPQAEKVELTTNSQLQTMLLKTVLKVATTYRTVLMSNAFPSSLKNPLLQLSVVNKPSTRLMVQQILHTLIDRHNNLDKFSRIWIPEDIAELYLTVEKPSRQDVHFMSHGGQHILWHLMENLRLPNNDKANIESLYTTMCLLLVELVADETLVAFASFILNLQEAAIADDLSPHQCAVQIHATVIAFASVFAELAGVTELQEHISQVASNRKSFCPHLLPELAIYGTGTETLVQEIPENCLLDKTVFKSSLEHSGLDIANLSKPMTMPDNMEVFSGKDHETTSIGNLEIDSLESSPTLRRNSTVIPADERLTFSQIKTALASEEDLAAVEAIRRQTRQEFETAPLEIIMNRATSRSNLHDRLFEILGDDDVDGALIDTQQAVAIENIKYPAMFVY